LERDAQAIGLSLASGETATEVFDLVAQLGDGGVLGNQLGAVGTLGCAAVLGYLHLVGDAC
jgi:hypothetical protein